MRIRALIIDSKPQLRRIVSALFDDIPSSQVTGAATTHEATLAIQSTHPNMIFLGYGSQDIHPDSLLSLIQKIKLRTVLIPVVETPTADLLKSLLPHPQVVDLLARDAEPERIRAAIQKALDHLFHSQLEPSTYRGFVGFVGVTPTLQQRKVLQTARLGILHNRSIRLAIEYWRKNPKSQLIAILLNTSYKFTSRSEESLESWEGMDFKPWEITMFEAQTHYLQYWQEPIRDGLLSQTIPTLLHQKEDTLTQIPPEEQMEVLLKIGKKAQRGEIEAILKAMRIPLQTPSLFVGQRAFKDFVRLMEKTMETVDKAYPHLTRPPEETGYENWKPDIATPLEDPLSRMVFIEKLKED